MKGLGFFTAPASELVKPNVAVAARSIEIAGAKSDAAPGISPAAGSFLEVLDQTRDASRSAPAPTPVAAADQFEEHAGPETRQPEVRSESTPPREEQQKAKEEKPAERNGDAQAQHEERVVTQEKGVQGNGAREKKERPTRAETGNEKNEKSAVIEKRPGTAGERVVATNESETPREKKTAVWREMNQAFAELNLVAVTQHEQVKARSTTSKKNDHSEQPRAGKSTESGGFRISEKVELKSGMVEKDPAKVRTKNEELTQARENREQGRAEQAARQVYGFVREGAPDKNTEQLLLDPSKWSVHGRVGESAREGDSAKETRLPKNIERAIRMDAPRTTEEAGHREAGNDSRQGAGTEREIFQSRFESPARLLENSEARQAALRESRELFNSLVQKARVNLGQEGQSSATIRLKPEFLGNMTLNLKVEGNRVEAVLLVDNQNARKLLTDEIEGMRQELRTLGVQIESFSIRVREGGMAQFNTGAEDSAFNQAGTNDAPSDRQGRRDADREAFHGDLEVPLAVAGVAAESEYETHLPANGASGRVNLAV